MFTGIIEEIGEVQEIIHLKNLSILKINVRKITRDLKEGDSVAVNGVCLTLTAKKDRFLTFDIMRETILRTNLKNLKKNAAVNLERALKAGQRLSGHFVTGHVDDVVKLKRIFTRPNYLQWQVNLKRRLVAYIVPKGSVCLDGVSLTIGEVKKNYFSVFLIPWTKDHTILGSKKPGDPLNIETDILAKYVLNKN